MKPGIIQIVFSCLKKVTEFERDRSGRLQMFFKTGFFENFAIFTWKHLCWSLFLIKLKAFRSETLLERESEADVFL